MRWPARQAGEHGPRGEVRCLERGRPATRRTFAKRSVVAYSTNIRAGRSVRLQTTARPAPTSPAATPCGSAGRRSLGLDDGRARARPASGRPADSSGRGSGRSGPPEERPSIDAAAPSLLEPRRHGVRDRAPPAARERRRPAWPRGRWRRPSPRRRARRSSRSSPRRPSGRWRARRSCRRRRSCATARSRARSRRRAISATAVPATFVSFALVATTPMVVFSPARGRARRSRARRAAACARRRRLPSGLRTPATTLPVSGSMMSPTALTATMRRDDEAVRQRDGALSRCPPSSDRVPGCRRNLPTVAPAPAPTLPSAHRRGRSPRRRPCSRSRPSAGSSGCRRTPRSNRIAAGTIGTTPRRRRASRCCARRASARRPVAASSPNALPPASDDRVDLVDHVDGIEEIRLARARARRRAATTPPTAPSPSTRITVQPVGRSASVKWPTLMPSTAVSPLPRVPAGAAPLWRSAPDRPSPAPFAPGRDGRPGDEGRRAAASSND